MRHRAQRHTHLFMAALLMLCVACVYLAGPQPQEVSFKEKTPSPLNGKRICLDPGHGGAATGAVGVKGLRESDVNLKVARFLKKMLEDAGATVFMTRNDDTDIGIIERAQFNKKHNTDLFVSIHHNANAQVDLSMNRTEVFYHWKDRGGPSEDAARHLYRELQAGFKLPNSKVYMCWAYGVLRENSYPAILAELSYISNPEEEERLRDEGYLRREAEAYFRALEAFFAGGRPEVKLVEKSRTVEGPVIRAEIVQPAGSALVDPQRMRVELDGQPVQHVFHIPESGKLFIHLPDEIEGKHELVVAGRNLAGHSSRVERQEISVKQPSKAPQTQLRQLVICGDYGPAKPDSLEGAELFGPQVPGSYTVSDQKGIVEISETTVATEPHVARAVGYWSEEIENTEKQRTVILQPMFRRALHRKVIAVDPEGGGDDPVAIGPKGLRASDANLETALYLADYLRQAGAEVSMTRTIDMSMDNVSRVRFGLERNPEVFLSIGHRLPEPGMGDKPGQNVTRIGHRWEDGGSIARSLIFHLRQLLGTGEELGDVSSREPLKSEIHNWSSWEVMHAAQRYKAVYVCPQMFDAPGVEERISTTAGCRKEALALLYGLLDYFGLDDRKMGTINGQVVDSESGKPVADALVWLKGTLVAQTEADGKFLFKFLETGKHRIKVMAEGYQQLKKEVEAREGETVTVKLELVPPAAPAPSEPE